MASGTVQESAVSLGWGLSPTAPQGGVGLLGWRHLGQLTEESFWCLFFSKMTPFGCLPLELEKSRTAQ